jgi:hypothetical protein
MRPHRSLRLIAALVLLAIASRHAMAHEGHDHGAEAKSVALSALLRAEASSDTFELVAVARSDEIIIYLDRFVTNEPMPDANVLVETPNGSVEAASYNAYRWRQRGENRLTGTSVVSMPKESKGAVQMTTPSGTTVQAKFNSEELVS